LIAALSVIALVSIVSADEGPIYLFGEQPQPAVTQLDQT